MTRSNEIFYTLTKDASLGSCDGLSGVSRLEAAGEGQRGKKGRRGRDGEVRRKSEMVGCAPLEIHE